LCSSGLEAALDVLEEYYAYFKRTEEIVELGSMLEVEE
jgi:hypothetical protein